MPIQLVVSDVDGTLVTSDKQLTPATIEAVKQLDASGIAFTVASSRPPVGLRSLVEALGLRHPMGAFKGSTIVTPDLSPIFERRIDAASAREAVSRLREAEIDVWVFAHGVWSLRDPHAPYTDRERLTLGVEPAVVADLDPLLDAASKIVGVCEDFERLAQADTRLATMLGERAVVRRSQNYYLDITASGVSKGTCVAFIADRLGTARDAVAVLGDAGNDVPMFREAGISIAMGNASAAVRREASTVTASNDEDGFAKAVKGLLSRR